jgi:hypothetical protein
MANQVATERQNKAREEGAKAFIDRKSFDANPYPAPKPFQEPHQGPERAAWEAGWMSGEILKRNG